MGYCLLAVWFSPKRQCLAGSQLGEGSASGIPPFSLEHGQHLFVQVVCASSVLSVAGSGARCSQAQSREVVLSLGCERSKRQWGHGRLVLSEGLWLGSWADPSSVGLLEAGVCSENGCLCTQAGPCGREPQWLCVTPDLPSRGRANTAGNSLHEVIARNATSLSSSLPRAMRVLQQDRDRCGAARSPAVTLLSWSCRGVWSGFLTICFCRGKI